MVKYGSATSIDFMPTKSLARPSPSHKSSILFVNMKERDGRLYKQGKEQMVENIELEKTKEERAKRVDERKKNRHKYRSELQTKLSMCHK